MGCSFSGLNALYDNVNGGADVWINENRFRIVRQLGEGAFSYVYLVKEVLSDSSPASAGGGLSKKLKDSSLVSGSIPSSFTRFSVSDVEFRDLDGFDWNLESESTLP